MILSILLIHPICISGYIPVDYDYIHTSKAVVIKLLLVLGGIVGGFNSYSGQVTWVRLLHNTEVQYNLRAERNEVHLD